MLVIGRQEVESLLDLNQLVEALAGAMAELSSGSVSMPPRAGAMVPEQGAVLGAMPAYLPAPKVLETKLVSVFPKNAGLGLPTLQAAIYRRVAEVEFDAEQARRIAIRYLGEETGESMHRYMMENVKRVRLRLVPERVYWQDFGA